MNVRGDPKRDVAELIPRHNLEMISYVGERSVLEVSSKEKSLRTSEPLLAANPPESEEHC